MSHLELNLNSLRYSLRIIQHQRNISFCNIYRKRYIITFFLLTIVYKDLVQTIISTICSIHLGTPLISWQNPDVFPEVFAEMFCIDMYSRSNVGIFNDKQMHFWPKILLMGCDLDTMQQCEWAVCFFRVEFNFKLKTTFNPNKYSSKTCCVMLQS